MSVGSVAAGMIMVVYYFYASDYLYYGYSQQPVSLAYHKEWKQVETASLGLSKANKIHLPAPGSSLINMFSFCTN